MSDNKRLTLFGTSGCHLCEQASALITECLPTAVIDYIDIAEQEHWQTQYALRIPVLCHPETMHELDWPFTANEVLNFFSKRCDFSKNHGITTDNES